MNGNVEKEFTAGGVTIALWNNQQQGQSGSFQNKTISIFKRYKKNGEWMTTNTLKPVDTSVLIPLLNEVFKYTSIKTH